MINKWPRIVGVYEVVGGGIGFLFSLYILFTNSVIFSSTFLIISFLTATLLYTFMVTAGILLLKESDHGYSFTKIIQLIQVPHFTIAGFTYLFLTGLQISFTAGSKSFGLNLTAGNFFDFAFSNEGNGWMIGINLIPIIALILINKKPHALEEKIDLNELNEE